MCWLFSVSELGAFYIKCKYNYGVRKESWAILSHRFSQVFSPSELKLLRVGCGLKLGIKSC